MKSLKMRYIKRNNSKYITAEMVKEMVVLTLE